MGVTLSEAKINECLKTGDEQIDCVDTGCTLMLLQKVQDYCQTIIIKIEFLFLSTNKYSFILSQDLYFLLLLKSLLAIKCYSSLFPFSLVQGLFQ